MHFQGVRAGWTLQKAARGPFYTSLPSLPLQRFGPSCPGGRHLPLVLQSPGSLHQHLRGGRQREWKHPVQGLGSRTEHLQLEGVNGKLVADLIQRDTGIKRCKSAKDAASARGCVSAAV